jgi:NADH:ubiquinone oxidoreductase subunit F (NADH-binding)/Pyruvate/2-oxoacid:ferredoxin oxidoreductase delta subunit/(2Fe-2S) ferredoxin
MATHTSTPCACTCSDCGSNTAGTTLPDLAAIFADQTGNGGQPFSQSDSRQHYYEQARFDVIDRPVIFIGAGTCGLSAGADSTLQTLRSYLRANEMQADLIEVGCIGYCVGEPLVDIQIPGRQRVSFSMVTADKVDALFDAVFKEGRIPKDRVLGQYANPNHTDWEGVPRLKEHPFFARQLRWVLRDCGVADPLSIDEYIARGGFKVVARLLEERAEPATVCQTVLDSGLRGRGGGGFLTGMKWKFALATEADQKYLVCNADEGDPGAFMDRAIIEGDPYRLVEGLMIAAYAIGASKVYVYLRAEYPLAIKRLRIALQQAEKYGLLGANILGSDFSLEIAIKEGAGAFVCGEETALIHSIEGRRGMPRPRPPYPAVSGLFGKPTVINNVETLANIRTIFELGADEFGRYGTPNSKGTKVFALSGKIVNTGLVEVAMGTDVQTIIYDIGGGIPGGKRFKAVQMGGPSGGCIPESKLDTPIDYDSLLSVGAMMGSGGMVVMDEQTCMVDVAKFFLDFIQRESCGKCIPCREGTRQLLEVFEGLTRSRRSETGNEALHRFKSVMSIRELAEVIKETSLCGLGQSAPNPLLSTLRWFMDEYDAHIYERRCPAGACTELLHFTISEALCVGCTLCKKQCPVDAIVGKVKVPHVIIESKCIGCGACAAVCPKDAVLVS